MPEKYTKLSEMEESDRRIAAALRYHNEFETAVKSGLNSADVIDSLINIHFDDDPPAFFPYVTDKGRIDCTALAQYFRENERYVFVSGKHESSRAIRYLYDDERGLYVDVSDIALQSKIKEYIECATPDNVRARDITETFFLITRDKCFISADDMNRDETIINFRNGILNIETGAFTAHSPDILSSIQLNAEYDPNKVYSLDDAPTFKKYLETLTAGEESEKKQALLLEYLGACVSNVAGYRFKKALFLKGEGDSGKSQFLEIICRILGEGNSQAVEFSGLSDRFAAAGFYDKRFIFSGDAEFHEKKSNAMFMSIIGGDPIRVEEKGMREFTAHCKGMMLFSSNYLPTWSGNKTAAAYNRIIVVICDNVIPREKQDKHLIDKMMRERNAIVFVALQALKAAIQRGYRFTITNESQFALGELRKINQPRIAFFNECCITSGTTGRKLRERKTQVHAAYRAWYAENYPDARCTINGFAAEIAQHLGLCEKDIIVTVNGIQYYVFELSAETKEQYHIFNSIEE